MVISHVAQVFSQWLFCALEVLLETILEGTIKMMRGDKDINSHEDGGSMSGKLPINRN